MNQRYLGSSKDDYFMVTQPMTNWLGIVASTVPNSVKNLVMYTFIATDRFYGGDTSIPVTEVLIDEINESVFRMTISSTDLRKILNADWKKGVAHMEQLITGKNRTKEDMQRVEEFMSGLGEVKFQNIIGDQFVLAKFTSTVVYNLRDGSMEIDVNKRFITYMRDLNSYSKTYGYMESLSSYALSPKALALYSFICLNDKAIETQKIKDGIEYTGVLFSDLCRILGLTGRTGNRTRTIKNNIDEINLKLNLHLNVRYIYSGKTLKRAIFYCEKGGVHMAKYFEKKKPLPRVTNELVELFKVKYEGYYGETCKIKSEKLDYELRQSFEIFNLNIYSQEDRDWYEHNVLDDLFKKYDDLGYSEGKKFGAGHLHVDWLMVSLVNGIKNEKVKYNKKEEVKAGEVDKDKFDKLNDDTKLADDEVEEF